MFQRSLIRRIPVRHQSETFLYSRIGLQLQQRQHHAHHHWDHIEPVSLDAIKQLTIAFKADPSKDKVLLGEGCYRDNEGKPFVLRSVRQAEKKIIDTKMDHEYAPVTGVPTFVSAAREFLFGTDCAPVKEERVASVQTISGTGALKIAATFLQTFARGGTKILLPKPTWVNHHAIFNSTGFGGQVQEYRYFDKKTNGMDVAGCLEDIRNAPKQSVIVLHACAHNPTGVDPNMDTWKKISDICKERDHIVFFDVAYQGFASGDPARDAAAVRLFADEGHDLLACQSFAKNFGLYGERVGNLNVVCSSKEQAAAVTSQLSIMIRRQYSNPPIHGARIVSTVLNTPELKDIWFEDVRTMSGRLQEMRSGLEDALVKVGSKKNWDHINSQIGMFAYSGLTPEQVQRLIDEYHIYMTKDGRISISGLNTHNLEKVATAIHNVTK